MKNIRIAFPLAILGCMALGFLTALTALRTNAAPVEGGHAQWSSKANAVAEQVREADAIVRVRVESIAQARVLTHDLGTGPDGKARIERTPFTDVRMSVLEVYHGDVGRTITVMQTGGDLPATAQQSAYRAEIEGDRLYDVGSEHILFLKDISGDRLHAPDRNLYRTVNPAGRYRVDGPRVWSTYEFGRVEERPTQLQALLSDIRRHRDGGRIQQQ